MYLLGGDSKQQEESEENSCTILEVIQPSSSAHQNKDVTSVEMTVLEDEEHVEENSCTIVDVMLASEPAHQKEEATSSEFEMGMAATSNVHQPASDSPIKVPKVTEEFSQDSFPSLTIESMHANV